jgi:hypothetical protein
VGMFRDGLLTEGPEVTAELNKAVAFAAAIAIAIGVVGGAGAHFV